MNGNKWNPQCLMLLLQILGMYFLRPLTKKKRSIWKRWMPNFAFLFWNAILLMQVLFFVVYAKSHFSWHEIKKYVIYLIEIGLHIILRALIIIKNKEIRQIIVTFDVLNPYRTKWEAVWIVYMLWLFLYACFLTAVAITSVIATNVLVDSKGNMILVFGNMAISDSIWTELFILAIMSYKISSALIPFATVITYLTFCKALRKSFILLTKKLENRSSSPYSKEVTDQYFYLLSAGDSIDNGFSPIVFFVLIYSMSELFLRVYNFFVSNIFGSISAIYHYALIFFLLQILFTFCSAAFLTMESAQRTKECLYSYLHRISRKNSNIHIMFALQEKKLALTFWKIYNLDRSFIFAVLGTMVTYGVLLATLGRN